MGEFASVLCICLLCLCAYHYCLQCSNYENLFGLEISNVLTWNVHFGMQVHLHSSAYLGHVCMSRSLVQGQGHRSKKCVCVSHLPMVCLRLKGSLVL